MSDNFDPLTSPMAPPEPRPPSVHVFTREQVDPEREAWVRLVYARAGDHALVSEHPTLTTDDVLAALRAHPEGATIDDIRRAATPGRVDIRPELEEWGGLRDDPLSGPAVWRETWPDDVQVRVAIDLAREAGWLIRVESPPWGQSRMAEMISRYHLEGRAPLPMRKSPGRSAPGEGGFTFPLRAPMPEPTPAQLALPLPDRLIAFLVAAGGGGAPLAVGSNWGLRLPGWNSDTGPWRPLLDDLEARGYRVDWWWGGIGGGWVRLAAHPPVTLAEAAQLLGLTTKGADYLLRERGIEPVERIGRSRRFRCADIAALAAEDRRPGRRPSVTTAAERRIGE